MSNAEYQNREDQLIKRHVRPMTPGQVVAGLREELQITQTELAQRLGVSRATVNELLNNRRGLTPDMAHRLGRFFGDGPLVWLRLQADVEMWDVLHMDQARYESIVPFITLAEKSGGETES